MSRGNPKVSEALLSFNVLLSPLSFLRKAILLFEHLERLWTCYPHCYSSRRWPTFAITEPINWELTWATNKSALILLCLHGKCQTMKTLMILSVQEPKGEVTSDITREEAHTQMMRRDNTEHWKKLKLHQLTFSLLISHLLYS